MTKYFNLQYRINDESYQIRISARDWHEAEAILACIKDNGFISGEQIRAVVVPELMSCLVKDGDSRYEH